MATVEVTTKRCIWCKKSSKLKLDKDRYATWQSGVHVQTAFPSMSSDVRELLISGTHPNCWEEMYSDED